MSRADETKTKILNAALEEFSTYGVAGARVDRISAAAGCNKNLLYVYFTSKENLFTTVLEQHLRRVYEDIPFTPEDLPGFAGRVFDFAMANPNLMRLLAWSTLEPTIGSLAGRAPSHDAKIEALQRAQSGGLTSAEFSPAFLVTTVMAVATAWSAASPFATSEQPPLPDLRRQVLDTIRRLSSTAAEDA
ncbi:TetR family transcriptional regulator [Acidiferrimicrobium sp. IK]|uniref:TetR family transcriptional regulator n=1 Tax=Acidiferrimicrobium sp. IK TaxID=2871700 RepID=UPI0021CB01A9|nr:TetR family transcriptional regulator [Acidiferrimicrobium sp. IK]MCU4186783.1 TetR family transcriptional regulator [Acidiferrimicrobium sp. IK]